MCETSGRTLLGPVEQFGVLATLSRWRPRVQIPSGPLWLNRAAWLGSSVGTSDRLKSDRSPVRSRPQPLPRKAPTTVGAFRVPVSLSPGPGAGGSKSKRPHGTAVSSSAASLAVLARREGQQYAFRVIHKRARPHVFASPFHRVRSWVRYVYFLR
jgi:hypothetical protein